MDTTAARPRLLAATGPLLLSPLDWVLGAIAEAGFAGAELLTAHNPETRDAARVLRYAEREGLDIPVVHGPYMVVLRNVFGSAYPEKSERALEFAAELSADILVAHAPFRWERKGKRWLAEEADARADAVGVKFAMENLFPVAGREFSSVVTPEHLLAFRHIVFDTSHFSVSGTDLFQAWDLLADRVAHLHVSDNFGNGKDSHAPIGTGVLPLERFLARVGQSGYTGAITLEVDCRAYMDSRRNLVAFLSRERQKAETLLAGNLESTAT